ncbi:MAG: AMP-binding protein, partial [Dehalococcoidia bacterium]
GLPKGIMISHHNLVAGAQIVSTYLGNTSEDRVLGLLPINLDYGLNQLSTMIRVGATLVLQHSLLPGDILRSLRQEDITGLAGMPPVWTLLLQARSSLEQEPLTSLRYISNSGGMIPNTHLEQLRRALPNTKIYLMYGLTEAFRSTYLPPEEVHRGPSCIGRAIPNTAVWVVNVDGHEVEPGEVGELIHRGPTVALGYWGDEEKTAAVYCPNPLAPPELRQTDTVVYSGDLVMRGEDGFLYFVGRRDELIKTQGYRVSPGEVEQLLCGVPGVSEAVTFGQMDPLLGQRIVAVVSLNEGASCLPEDIRQNFSQKAPHYMLPKELHILRELPKTATGKIDRGALKNKYARE